MNYTLVPSLERLALTRTAITLWNQDDIKALLKNSYVPLLRSERSEALQETREKWQYTERDREKYWEVIDNWHDVVGEWENIVEKWHEIEEKVIEKLLQLPHPKPLKAKILGVIRATGLQIILWMKYHNGPYLGMDLPTEFCWSPQGTIDEKKTAEVLIKDENLNVARRYKLACIYCLEDYIPGLWKKIPNRSKCLFYRKENPRDVRQQGLVTLWTYDIRGEVDKLSNVIEESWSERCTPYQYAFEFAVISGNKAAAMHFFQKLNSAEKEESFVRCETTHKMNGDFFVRSHFPNRNYPEVFCFLLSHMNEEQQLAFFETYSFEMSCCLLEWPWQDFFVESAKRFWNFLEPWFDWLLFKVVEKITDGFKDYDYQHLFKELWQQNSINHRKYVIGEYCCILLLTKLFQVKDKEKIKLILENVSTSNRKKFVFSDEGKRICESLINDDESDLLKFFVKVCISSKAIAIRFKENFETRGHLLSEREKYVWNKFYQLLDDLIEEDNKETDEEEENSETDEEE